MKASLKFIVSVVAIILLSDITQAQTKDDYKSTRDTAPQPKISRDKLSVFYSFQYNACGGNNVHTRHYANIGILFSSGIILFDIVSIGCTMGMQEMVVSPKYGPEYNNAFNDNNHQYYLNNLLAEIRVYPLKGRISPVLFGGYGRGKAFASENIDNGTMFNAGAGIAINALKELKFDISYIYQYQELYYDSYGYYYNPYKGDRGTLYLSYAGINISCIIHFGIVK